MNRPDKAGEPSMEEILASIRQIIADEPSTDPSEPAIEANPLVPQASQLSKPSETRVPLADRLSNVLKSGSLPPTSPLGSKRPLSFDQDLADMFDEEAPANGSSVVAPKPDIRVPTGLSHPMGAKPFVPPPATEAKEPQPQPEPVKEESAKPAPVDGAAALPPHFAPSEPLAPPPPFGGAEKPAEVPPAPTYGFPPLRKTSFYPPQPKAPVTPKPAQPGPFSMPSPTPASEPVAPAGDALKAPGGFGASAASGEAGGGTGRFAADPAAVPSQPFAASAPPAQATRYDAPGAPLSPFASSAPSPAAPSSPVGGAPAQPPYGSAPADPPFGAPSRPFGSVHERPIDAIPVQPVESRPLETRPIEPRSYADPFAQSARPGPDYTPQPRFGAEPTLSTDAAHQALDALAQGLAAAAASSAPAEPVSPAIPLTPVFEAPEPDPRPQPAAPSTLPATIPAQGSMPVNRTLEDAVADMLRPMLQQWVAENMPRIIERALRTEVAQTVKPGHKPPGT
jgi:cell pole-organizing protein PopZ